MAGSEIMARRRKWTAEEKAALLAEVEAEGGKVTVVARRHRISESLLYNWRSAWKAAAAAMRAAAAPVEFMPLGVFGRMRATRQPAMLAPPEQPSDRRSLAGRRRRSRGDRDCAAERCPRQRRCLRQREGAVAGAARDEGRDMISLAPGTKVFLACRPVDLRNGFDGLAAKVAAGDRRRSFRAVSLFMFRGKRGDYFKATVLGWHRVVAVRQAAGEGPLRVAADRRWRDDADAGAVGGADRGDGLAPHDSTAAADSTNAGLT